MGTLVDFSREIRELQEILSSGLFDRSPMLAQLLKYVCTKYFEGSTDSIKEYSLAVDVLGRAPNFDPKKDSIIRVQFHRLREKLSEYYAGEGADHAFHIVIPHGHYAPQFTFHPEFNGNHGNDHNGNGQYSNGHHAIVETNGVPHAARSDFVPVEAPEVRELPTRPVSSGLASGRWARPLGWVVLGIVVLGLVAFS